MGGKRTQSRDKDTADDSNRSSFLTDTVFMARMRNLCNSRSQILFLT